MADFVADGSTVLGVNLPPLSLPEHVSTHRLAHLHHNVPGVLAAINRAGRPRGERRGQLLGTRGDVGYVLTDIGVNYAEERFSSQLRELPETVRLRVLY